MSDFHLTGDGIILRDFHLNDAEDVLAIIGDDRITRFLSFDSRSLNHAYDMIERAQESARTNPRVEYYLAVVESERPDAVVGFIRLAKNGEFSAKLGYATAVEHQGKGLARRAISLMIRFGFEVLSLHRITAAIGPENIASLAAIKSQGFVQEGRLRDHVFTNNAWRDSLLFSRLASDT